MSQSFKCPKCSGNTAVKDSRPNNIAVRRRRHCCKCGFRFTTHEWTYDDLQQAVAAAMAEKRAQLLAVFDG